MSPLMRSHCYLVATLKSQPVVMVASCKANSRPHSQDQEHSLHKVLASTFGLGERELWSCSKLSARLVWGSENLLARKASTSCAWRFYVQVAWYFYVHFLRITSTCTSTCALHDKPRFDWENGLNLIVYVIHTMNSEKLAISTGEPFWKAHDYHSRAFSLCAAFSIREPSWKARDFYSRAILKSSQSPFARLVVLCSVILFASHSEKLPISTRELFWKARDLYSCAFPWAQRLLFAPLSLCAAFPICEPFWKARNLYLRAVLKMKSTASCFFQFLGLPNGTYQL